MGGRSTLRKADLLVDRGDMIRERAANGRPNFFTRVNVGDRTYALLLTALGGAVLIVAGLIVFVLWQSAQTALATHPLEFIAGSDWDPVRHSFGALPFIYGTLITSVLSIIVAVPIALGLAIFLVEIAPSGMRPVVSFPLELLAGIPSVVYGLWGLFVMVPWLRERLEPFLGAAFGFVPLFRGPPLGLGYLAGGLILPVMIFPPTPPVPLQHLHNIPASSKED